MNEMLELLANREKGQIPVSIATSLAIEGAAGIYPEREESPAPIIKGKYKEIWFNVRTIFRNLFEACDRERRHILSGEVMAIAMVEEFGIIEAAVTRITNGSVRVVFYLPDYSAMPRVFPRALLRHPATPKQITQAKIEKDTLKVLPKEDYDQDVRFYNGLDIKGPNPEALIVTHCLPDLLSRYNFRKLDLLESHTGVIKPYTQWSTKLTGGKDLEHLPFCPLTLQLFGDKGHQFNSMSLRYKRTVQELAASDNWTAVTTKDKMRMSFQKIQDPSDRALIVSLL